MRLPTICRTCDTTDCDTLYVLATPAKLDSEKVLSDLLTELTGIDVSGFYAQKLPQLLCSSCTPKLINSYSFVNQARTANDILSNRLLNAQMVDPAGCVKKPSFELNSAKIKMETRDDELNITTTCSELPQLTQIKQTHDDLLLVPDAIKEEWGSTICRTCDTKHCDTLYNLATPTNQYPEKMLLDLLTELIGINVNETQAQKLPQVLCSSCTPKLIDGYYFVNQARTANEMLMNHLLNSQVTDPSHCIQNFGVEIKTEAKDYEVDNATICMNQPELAQFQQAEDDTLILPDAIKQEQDTQMSLAGLFATGNATQGYKDELLMSPEALKQEQDTEMSPIEFNANNPRNGHEDDDSLDRSVRLIPYTELPKSDTFQQSEFFGMSYGNGVNSSKKAMGTQLISPKELKQEQDADLSATDLDATDISSQGYDDDDSLERSVRLIPCTVLPDSELFHQGKQLMSSRALQQEQNTDISYTGLEATDAHGQDYVNDSFWSSLNDLQQRNLKLKKKRAKKRYNCYECPKSFSRADYLKRHCSRTHIPKSDWLPCTFCDLKFSRSDALQAHLKDHRDPKSLANRNEGKKVKDIDLNLCKPHGSKLIECMICHSKFDKIIQLRCHLEQHPDIFNFEDQHKLRAHELAELLYSDLMIQSSEHLQDLIFKELASGAYQRFCSITNQFGHEINLDSSETESDEEYEVGEKKIKKTQKEEYMCELCQQSFPRKYQLYDHQRLSHSWSEAPHVCGRCDMRFVSLQLLQHHNDSQCKNAQKRYSCSKCPLRFRWKHNLKAHSQDNHITNQTFECHECKRVFDKKKSLTVHLLSVHADESKLIPCQWCNRKFYRRDYLVKHLKRHGINEQDIPLAETLIAATSKPNGPKIITCKICNIQFSRISDLRSHIEQDLKSEHSLHQNLKSLENYSITNDSGFELQLDDSETEDEGNTVSDNAPSIYACGVCQVQCRRKYEMIQHQSTIHRFDKIPYNCERCIFKCVSKKIMDHHKQVQCLCEQKKHVCSKCSFKFMWPENLEKHVQSQHGGWQEEKSDNTSLAAKSEIKKCDSEAGIQVLSCPHCDRTYKRKSRLSNHIRDVHINKKKTFVCSVCGKDKPSAGSLVAHMKRHTGEKHVKCNMCEMSFPSHSEMVAHRRMHTGEKPFHCTVCGNDFSSVSNLKRHVLTHSDLKPYKCNFCDRCYRQAHGLKNHMKQHSNE